MWDDLTEEESARLASELERIRRETQHARPPTLERFVARWAQFVRDVESGYPLSIYEYTNDLSVRDVLDDIIAAVPERLGNRIRGELQVWDDRFRLATRKSAKPVAPGAVDRDELRWFRVPRNLGGELEDDLRSEGLID